MKNNSKEKFNESVSKIMALEKKTFSSSVDENVNNGWKWTGFLKYGERIIRMESYYQKHSSSCISVRHAVYVWTDSGWANLFHLNEFNKSGYINVNETDLSTTPFFKNKDYKLWLRFKITLAMLRQIDRMMSNGFISNKLLDEYENIEMPDDTDVSVPKSRYSGNFNDNDELYF